MDLPEYLFSALCVSTLLGITGNHGRISCILKMTLPIKLIESFFSLKYVCTNSAANNSGFANSVYFKSCFQSDTLLLSSFFINTEK